MSVFCVKSKGENEPTDHDLAHLAEWATNAKEDTPNPSWKRPYALIREGADLLLRRRAMSRVEAGELHRSVADAPGLEISFSEELGEMLLDGQAVRLRDSHSDAIYTVRNHEVINDLTFYTLHGLVGKFLRRSLIVP